MIAIVIAGTALQIMPPQLPSVSPSLCEGPLTPEKAIIEASAVSNQIGLKIQTYNDESNAALIKKARAIGLSGSEIVEIVAKTESDPTYRTAVQDGLKLLQGMLAETNGLTNATPHLTQCRAIVRMLDYFPKILEAGYRKLLVLDNILEQEAQRRQAKR